MLELEEANRKGLNLERSHIHRAWLRELAGVKHRELYLQTARIRTDFVLEHSTWAADREDHHTVVRSCCYTGIRAVVSIG